ncbi:hypothetical protein SHAQ108633_00940 [Shewanella aquimarina]
MKPKRLLVGLVVVTLLGLGYQVASELTKDYVELDALEKVNGRFHLRDEAEPYSGKAKYFAEEGWLKQQATLHQGKLNGELVSFYETGAIEVVEPYVDGQLEGVTRVYLEDGTLNKTIPYHNGLKEGTEAHYGFEGGLLSKSIEYRQGKRNGWSTSYWDPDRLRNRKYHRGGKLAEEGQYQDGEKVGVWRRFSPDGRLISVGEEPKARLEADSAQNSVPRAQSKE